MAGGLKFQIYDDGANFANQFSGITIFLSWGVGGLVSATNSGACKRCRSRRNCAALACSAAGCFDGEGMAVNGQ